MTHPVVAFLRAPIAAGVGAAAPHGDLWRAAITAAVVWLVLCRVTGE